MVNDKVGSSPSHPIHNRPPFEQCRVHPPCPSAAILIASLLRCVQPPPIRINGQSCTQWLCVVIKTRGGLCGMWQVLSGAFQWVPQGKQAKVLAKTPPRPCDDDILLLKLRPGQVGRSVCAHRTPRQRADAPNAMLRLHRACELRRRRRFSRASNSKRTAKRGSARHTRSGRRSPPRRIDCFRRLSSSSRSR